MNRLWVTVIIGWLVGAGPLASVARAHQVGLSQSTFSVDAAAPRVARVELSLARAELLALSPAADADLDGALSDAEVGAVADTAAELVAAVAVRQAGSACSAAWGPPEPSTADGVHLWGRFTCAEPVSTAVVTAGFLNRLSPGHRHLVTHAGGPGPQMLSAASPSTSLVLATAGTAAPPPFDFAGVFTLGVEHILTGFDHLVFLLGLLLVGGSISAMLGVITAFTVAHSFTLALAALGLVAPPSAIVEAAIAASILYVGLENLVVERPRHRARLTFAFGLVHGFGFAGALAEAGLRDHVVPTLLGFNLGVEAGQLAVAAVVLPLLVLARRRASTPAWGRAVRVASVGICLAGAGWLVERTLG
jgi:hypothetical protein